jgi:hypothetical protein
MIVDLNDLAFLRCDSEDNKALSNPSRHYDPDIQHLVKVVLLSFFRKSTRVECKYDGLVKGRKATYPKFSK